MRICFVAVFAALLLATGCAATHDQSKVAQDQVMTEQVMPKGLVDMVDNQYFVWEKAGRIYVLGQEQTNRSFAEHVHPALTKTLLGAGPRGETVIFEVAKKDPALTERIMQTFMARPYPLDQADNYFVFGHNGRIYVVGSEASRAKFIAHGHIPYARTQIGAGPNGETLVFEIDKKHPEQTDRLEQAFAARPFPLRQDQDYYVYKHNGRIYILGSEAGRAKFVAHGHIPYARTLIGAGPNGETVIFEIDKKHPEQTARLEQTFRG